VRGSNPKTKSTSLGLQPGDWVKVKSRKEIKKTLDVRGKNRGLEFRPPMLEYCGKSFRVANRLDKIILEDSGKMIPLQNTVTLCGVTCKPEVCPRANFHFWREDWLKHIGAPVTVENSPH
jgi:hypothetical protein